MPFNTDKIFSVTPNTFEGLSLRVFEYQFNHCGIYRDFCLALGKNPLAVKSVEDIPFLPIEFFRNRIVLSNEIPSETVFASSGTTGSQPSKHYVGSLNLYEQSFSKAFNLFFGKPEDYVILGLLPGYIERGDSSLVYMVDKLIIGSNNPVSGFFLSDFHGLFTTLNSLKSKGQKTLLIGVTHALLDFSENYQIDFPELIVMETGGMKGRRVELTRPEIHSKLSQAYKVKNIHSEYGMTELLSQAYSHGNGIFQTPPWMKVFIRDAYEPLQLMDKNSSGGINIIDLANVYSCSFIATGDLGRLEADGSFKVLGRLDNAEIRGCNLMVS